MLVLQLVAQLVPQFIHVASCGWRGVPTSTHHYPSTNCGSSLILLFLLLSTETHISFITHSALFTIPPLSPLSPSIHLRHAERGPKHASTERRDHATTDFACISVQGSLSVCGSLCPQFSKCGPFFSALYLLFLCCG